MSDQLVGVKQILRYLAERHAVVICRQTLHRLRTAPEREFSCSQIEAGAAKFPADPVFDGLTVTIVAERDQVDLWVERHRRRRVVH